ncbi:MAG: DUF1653 domain-containing protein [Lachnospiraceae bacterium]|nr:DUF1653 domain-containing protein [Lachnospiraceae bacterium]
MSKVKIVKKKSEYSLEYVVGEEYEVDSTWYGGVSIIGKSGIPVPIEKDEYVPVIEIDNNIEETRNKETSDDERIMDNLVGSGNVNGSGNSADRDIAVGDIVRHFKREWITEDNSMYIYKILAFASHTETGEKLVVYQAMYSPFKVCARPYDMFMSEVDREKYPDVKQKYRFEKIEVERFPG